MQAHIKAELEDEIDFTLKADTSIKSLHVKSQDDDEFLSWSELHVEGLDYKHKEGFLNIQKLTLEQPHIVAYLNKDGSTSFSNLIKESETTQKKQKSEPMKLVNGTSDFSDDSLPFPFATFIHDLHGDFSTLDFQTTTPSLLNLSGKIDKYGYLWHSARKTVYRKVF